MQHVSYPFFTKFVVFFGQLNAKTHFILRKIISRFILFGGDKLHYHSSPQIHSILTVQALTIIHL